MFRIASGQLLGPDQPVDLRLLEIPPGDGRAGGRGDGADRLRLPAARRTRPARSTRNDAFDGANIALLVGSRPRTKGMERAELLSENGKIFTVQGKALNDHAAADVRVLVVGNPANTNCLIAMNNAPDIPRERFTAMLRLDHNRAIAQLANKLSVPVIRGLEDGRVGQSLARPCTPTCSTPRSAGARRPAWSTIRRGSRTTSCRTSANAARRSSRRAARQVAASAANAAIDHVHDWVHGTDGGWVSMGVPSDGSYGIPEGLICGFPCTCAGGEYSIVQGLELDEFSRVRKIDASVEELRASATPWPGRA